MEFTVVLALALVAYILGGAGFGIAAFRMVRQLRQDVGDLVQRQERLDERLDHIDRLAAGRPPGEEPPKATRAAEQPPPEKEAPPEPAAPTPPDQREAPEPSHPEPTEAPPPLPPAAEPVAARGRAEDGRSLELLVGMRWMAWVGIVMVLVGTAFFLKYLSDQGLFGPPMRLALGFLGGLAALGVGEYARRKDHQPLFQTLTGGGIAIFYICDFFAFRVFEMIDAGPAMALGLVITALGVVMAVGHNALAIAVLAVIGGFMSPILFSSGADRPYALFSYIAVLDLVAFGAAYYRRWRVLDTLCLAGTVILYQLWFVDRYEPDRLVPALVFAGLFYLMFLLIPTIYGLVRRVPLEWNSIAIVVLNSAHALYAFYRVLFDDHRMWLGFVVIAQAVLVFALFRGWSARISARDRTAESLLVIALALVTLAIPIQLRLYGVPIAWALEGALFTFLGLRFNQRMPLYGGAVALVLAAGGLLERAPLHTLAFTPVFNVPFGSWAVVIAAAGIAAYLVYREYRRSSSPEHLYLSAGIGLGAYALAGLLLTFETYLYWLVRRPPDYQQSIYAALLVLWTIIPTATALVLTRRLRGITALVLPWVGYGIAALVFLNGLVWGAYESDTTWFGLHPLFGASLLLVAAMTWAASLTRKHGQPVPAQVVEGAGQVLLVILLGVEFNRWGGTPAVDIALARALLSCAWALQACGLIWWGLVRRELPRRVFGFVLFGITVAHVVWVALEARLDPALQIVSFIGSGLLLLAAAWFYSRFRAHFLEDTEPEHEPAE